MGGRRDHFPIASSCGMCSVISWIRSTAGPRQDGQHYEYWACSIRRDEVLFMSAFNGLMSGCYSAYNHFKHPDGALPAASFPGAFQGKVLMKSVDRVWDYKLMSFSESLRIAHSCRFFLCSSLRFSGSCSMIAFKIVLLIASNLCW